MLSLASASCRVLSLRCLRSLAGPPRTTRPHLQSDRIVPSLSATSCRVLRLQRLRSLAGPSRTTRPRLQSDRIALARSDIVPSPKRPTLACGAAQPVCSASPSLASALSRTASSARSRPGASRHLPRRANRAESPAPTPRCRRRSAEPSPPSPLRRPPQAGLRARARSGHSRSAAPSYAIVGHCLIPDRSVR